MVLVILALTTAIVATRGPARDSGFDLNTAAENVAAQLRLTRAEAIATDRMTTFSFEPGRRRYNVNGRTGPVLPPEVTLAMETATGGISRPIRAISFSPDGSSSGGQVLLLAHGHRRSVVVNWLTGGVSIADVP